MVHVVGLMLEVVLAVLLAKLTAIIVVIGANIHVIINILARLGRWQ